MRFVIIFLIAFLLAGFTAGICMSTDDPVLFRIEDKEVSRSEFAEIYRKNNLESMVVEPKEVDEYLEMYINFRLKVKEAKNMGLDTNASFVEELNGYRQQLAQQYLYDNEVTARLIDEAWERSQYDIRASHILMNLDAHAMPEDTSRVYQKMLEVRQRFLEGEAFADLAREFSDDSSARDVQGTANRPARRGNGGDLGYFSAFHMVYPFETAAYNTPVGEISMPFRTNFGYHLVKTTDRLPAMGRARVAHIMLMTPMGIPETELAEKEEKIHLLHERLLAGEDFGELAQHYSEDQQSAHRKGEMQPFTSNRMVPQFIEAIHKLDEPGDLSPPVRSDFGWHIIKLIEKTPPPPYETAYVDLSNRIQRDARSQLGQDVVIKRLKEEYQFAEYPESLHEFYDVLDEDIFQGNWDKNQVTHLDKELFAFGTSVYNQQDFAAYLYNNQRRQNPMSLPAYINMQYQRFVNDRILSYEDGRLEKKYPEFRDIMKEYYDGMLLFEITNKKVWSKATSDTLGLEQFFMENRHLYQADELASVRGMVIADYQDFLEKQWVKALREKYDIWVDEQVLKTIHFDE